MMSFSSKLLALLSPIGGQDQSGAVLPAAAVTEGTGNAMLTRDENVRAKLDEHTALLTEIRDVLWKIAGK